MAKVTQALLRNTNWLSAWCVLGAVLSLYTLYVELQLESNRNFKALCDINSWVSCSKVFMSKYGRSFGLIPKGHPLNLPNPVFGIFFYMTQMILTIFCGSDKTLIRAIIGLSIVSNLGSLYLGYILFFILHDFCVVCVTIYVINLFMLLTAMNRSKIAATLRLKQEKRD
jgi:vitamin-K-epoxide reductase (warfarin-sensitive)